MQASVILQVWCAIKLNAFLPCLKTCSACFNDVKQWHWTADRAAQLKGGMWHKTFSINRCIPRQTCQPLKSYHVLFYLEYPVSKTTQKQTQRNVGYISFECFVPVSWLLSFMRSPQTAHGCHCRFTRDYDPRPLLPEAVVEKCFGAVYANEISGSLSHHLTIFSALPSNVWQICWTWIIQK